MLKRYLSLLIFLFIVTFLCGADHKEKCWIRVTLFGTSPKTDNAWHGVLCFTRPHIFTQKFTWGAKGNVIEHPTTFYSVINWEQMKDIPPIKHGTPGPWIELKNIYHIPNKKRWSHKPAMAASNVILTFFSPRNDNRKDRRPIFKRWESGNLEKIHVKVEFASNPDEKSIYRTITEKVDGSILRIFIDPQIKDVNCRIMSARSLLDKRIASLKKDDPESYIPKRILTSHRDNPGHFYPLLDLDTAEKLTQLHRLLGFRSVQYQSIELPEKFRKIFWKDCNPVFLEGPRPEWLSAFPGDTAMNKKTIVLAKKLQNIPQKKVLLIKFGDETKILPAKYLKNDYVKKQFTDYLKQHNVSPQDIGFPAFEKVEILADIRKAKTPETRRLYYYSTLFRGDIMLDWYKNMIDQIRQNYPGKLLATGEICWENSRIFPDIFRAYEKNVFDIASHECSVLLWLMPHSAIPRLVAQRSAARYFPGTRPGILYGSHRGGNDLLDIIEIDGTSALLHGMGHIYWYNDTIFNINGFRSETADKKIRMINRRAAQFEDLILNGESPLRKPDALLVKSFISELWHGANTGTHFREFEMAAAALAWSQLPFDILNDDLAARYCDNYKVIYLTSPVVPERLRNILIPWVRKGGRLVIAGQKTAMFNEFKEESSLLHRLGIKPNKDNVKRLGKGLIFFFRDSPGNALRLSFQPQDLKLPVQTIFHQFNPALLKPYLAPFTVNPALKRDIICDRNGVEINFFEAKNYKKCAVFAVDYTCKDKKKITLQLNLKGIYHEAKDETGKTYPVRRDNETSVVTVELGASNVFTLR